MAALMEPCYVCLGGIEIINSARAKAYVSAVGGNACGVNCGTAWPRHLCSPPDITYTTPSVDDAVDGSVWWLDPNQPGSEDIIGVTGKELSVTHGLKSGVGQASWGGFAGPLRYGTIKIQLSGTIHTRSRAGTAAARAMLIPALLGSLCGSSCEPPDLTFYEACSCDTGLSHLRTIKGVRFIPQDLEFDEEYPRDCGLRFTANFESISPYVWWPDVEWLIEDESIGGAVCAFTCDKCPETGDTPCQCGCLPALALPSRQLNTIGCACKPLISKRMCVTVDPPALWNGAAIVVKVSAGSKELKNLRIRAWPNPFGWPAPSSTHNRFACQTPCIDIEIGCIPKRGTLTVDGSTRDATLRCADGTDRAALSTLSSGGRGIRWPEIGGCTPLMFCVDSDGAATAADAKLSIGMQRAEIT